jgi:sugar O-acyltransferase (sialic acid O-acetyltransferase NeuD family)
MERKGLVAVSDLLIMGIHPHAIEMADIVERINAVHPTWTLVGFVSAFGDKVGEQLAGLPVLSEQEALERYPTAFIIPEHEWPKKVDLPRHRLATLIDPSTFVSRTACIGLGCVIYPHCYVGSNARIGDFLFCLSGSIINHNDVIGDRVTLTSGVVIAGDVHIEDDCYLGQACTIRELRRIGTGSLIGMGSVVLNDVAANSVMVGNPARRLRARHPRIPVVRAVRRAKNVARRVLVYGRRLMARASALYRSSARHADRIPARARTRT